MPAPEGTDKSFEIGTGQARVLTAADFSLTSSSAGGTTAIVVFAPAQGTIEIDGVRFTGALMMSTAVIEAGRLRYVAPDHATVDALAFSLVSSDGIDLTAANLVFDVASSIDTPPQFSAGDGVLGLDLSIASDDIRRLVVDDDGRITTLHSTVRAPTLRWCACCRRGHSTRPSGPAPGG
jgi:hypothetical protein